MPSLLTTSSEFPSASLFVDATEIVYIRFPWKTDLGTPVTIQEPFGQYLLDSGSLDEILNLLNIECDCDCFAELDGGAPDTFFGGLTPFDAGGV